MHSININGWIKNQGYGGLNGTQLVLHFEKNYTPSAVSYESYHKDRQAQALIQLKTGKYYMKVWNTENHISHHPNRWAHTSDYEDAVKTIIKWEFIQPTESELDNDFTGTNTDIFYIRNSRTGEWLNFSGHQLKMYDADNGVGEDRTPWRFVKNHGGGYKIQNLWRCRRGEGRCGKWIKVNDAEINLDQNRATVFDVVPESGKPRYVPHHASCCDKVGWGGCASACPCQGHPTKGRGEANNSRSCCGAEWRGKNPYATFAKKNCPPPTLINCYPEKGADMYEWRVRTADQITLKKIIATTSSKSPTLINTKFDQNRFSTLRGIGPQDGLVLSIKTGPDMSWYATTRLDLTIKYYTSHKTKITLIGNDPEQIHKQRLRTADHTPDRVFGPYDLNSDYELQFTIRPGAKKGGYTNILHSTMSNRNCCGAGDRIPGIWFYPGSHRLHIRSAIQAHNRGNIGVDPNIELPEGVETRVIINVHGPYMNVRYVNQSGKEFYNHTDNRQRLGSPAVGKSGTTLIYISDPWHPAANATIKNVILTT